MFELQCPNCRTNFKRPEAVFEFKPMELYPYCSMKCFTIDTVRRAIDMGEIEIK